MNPIPPALVPPRPFALRCALCPAESGLIEPTDRSQAAAYAAADHLLDSHRAEFLADPEDVADHVTVIR